MPVLPGLDSLELKLWLVMHRDLRAVRRLRPLFEHLAAALASYYDGEPPG